MTGYSLCLYLFLFVNLNSAKSNYKNNHIIERKVPLMTLEQIQKEKLYLLEQIPILTDRLKEFPDGEVLCNKNGKYIKALLRNGKNPIYLAKKDQALIESLAAKKYYTLQLEEYTKALKLIDFFLNWMSKRTYHATLLEDSSCYHTLIEHYFQTELPEFEDWMNSDYERNPSHPEHLIHKTISGLMVRSKSESIIANSLYNNKIPFRYESALHLENLVFFPDFTILHPKTKKIIYWEHFGMMDNHSYCENAFRKMNTYGLHGLIPTINMITTYETSDHPIDSVKIQQIIEEYFS